MTTELEIEPLTARDVNLSLTSEIYEDICLLIIDPQNDFHRGGSLAVAGADEDAERIASFIRTNKELLGSIVITLDSHNNEHIAHSQFWRNAEGLGPQPFTQIMSSDIGTLWFPKDESLLPYTKEYTQALESKGRFTLIIWPNHCIIGSKGQAVVDSIYAATEEFLWSTVDPFKTVISVKKGMNNLTEMYSAVEAEVPLPEDQRTYTNAPLIAHLKRARKVVVCGQALSHCVNYTTRDVLKNWTGRNPSDIILLSDCASSVPGFEESGRKFIEDMAQAGVTISTSTAVLEG